MDCLAGGDGDNFGGRFVSDDWVGDPFDGALDGALDEAFDGSFD